MITEPQDITVLSAIANDSNTMNLDFSGSSSYTITHNNRVYNTSNSNFKLNLVKGLNFIKVVGDKECPKIFTRFSKSGSNKLINLVKLMEIKIMHR